MFLGGANVAQLIEQLIRNQQVAGLSPAISLVKKPVMSTFCWLAGFLKA